MKSPGIAAYYIDLKSGQVFRCQGLEASVIVSVSDLCHHPGHPPGYHPDDAIPVTLIRRSGSLNVQLG